MNTCEYRKNIDCLYAGAVIFCQNCGFYPQEEKRRKAALNKNVVEIETERRKNVIRLDIKHNRKRVSYTIRRVRKLTDSSKYHRVSNSGQGDG